VSTDDPRQPQGWSPPIGAEQSGLPGTGAPAFGPPQSQRTPGKATAALVLGIVGLFICPLVCSVLAIVFGTQAKNEIDRDPSLGGRGLAQAGFVLGIVGLVIGVLIGVLIAAGTLTV
jgi:hypothetical protein